MILIDDATCYCYIYLLKTKDEAFHYFKIFKTEVENQIERKISVYVMIVEENTFSMSSVNSVLNMV